MFSLLLFGTCLNLESLLPARPAIHLVDVQKQGSESVSQRWLRRYQSELSANHTPLDRPGRTVHQDGCKTVRVHSEKDDPAEAVFLILNYSATHLELAIDPVSLVEAWLHRVALEQQKDDALQQALEVQGQDPWDRAEKMVKTFATATQKRQDAAVRDLVLYSYDQMFDGLKKKFQTFRIRLKKEEDTLRFSTVEVHGDGVLGYHTFERTLELHVVGAKDRSSW